MVMVRLLVLILVRLGTQGRSLTAGLAKSLLIAIVEAMTVKSSRIREYKEFQK